MAINVRIAVSKSAWGKGDSIDAEIFIEDGPYHFLLPEILELKDKFGKFIDQYGDAIFEPHTIKPLLAYLKMAQERVQKMKKVESLVIGVEKKSNKEVRAKVQKEEIKEVIEKLIVAAEKAQHDSKYLIFVGD